MKTDVMNRSLKNILYVFTASTLSKIIGAGTLLLLPTILAPASYGVWVTLLLIISYSPIVAFGTVEALLRQYPYYLGQGDLAKAREIEESVFGSIFVAASFLILLGISFPLCVTYSPINAYHREIQLIILASIFSLFSAFFFNRFAAHQTFKVYSIIDSLRAVITLLLVPVFAWLWGLTGAAFGYLVAEVVISITSAVFSFYICGRLGFTLNRGMMWQAIKIGFPITIIWWALTLQSSVDRLVSASFLGKEMTGYYGLGISIVSMLVLIPGAVNRVLYPKINEGIGKKLDANQLSALIISPVRILSVVIPILIGVLIISLPTIYKFIFPKYQPGLLSAQMLLLGFFFVGLIGNGANYLIAKNEQNVLLGYVFVSLITNAACAIYFVSIGFSIEGVAISTGLAAALLVTLIWRMVLKNMEYKTADQWRGLIGLYSPFALMLCLLFIYQNILPMYLNSIGLVSFIYALIFACTYLIIIFFMPPYSKWCKEIYTLFKLHLYSSPVLSESQSFK